MQWAHYLAYGAPSSHQSDSGAVVSSIITDQVNSHDLVMSTSDLEKQELIMQQINKLFSDELCLTPFSRTIAIGFVKVKNDCLFV